MGWDANVPMERKAALAESSWLSCEKRISLESWKCMKMLCVRVVEPMGFANMRFKVVVNMGRSEHRLHHELSNTLQNAALNP